MHRTLGQPQVPGFASGAPLNKVLLALVALFAFVQIAQAGHHVEHIGDHPAESCDICLLSAGSDEQAGSFVFELPIDWQQETAPGVSRCVAHVARFFPHPPRGPPSVTPAA
jgi:hypothetical protein